MIGKVISHYKILVKIGEGGMGVLYLANDLNINRKAVLKFLPSVATNNDEINSRFKREAQAAGSLSHPNIVTIFDVGVHEGKTFIAMEYIEGKTLRALINSDDLTIEIIFNISVQICEGLIEAHSKGIIHRDIKPENIIIDEKGRVKLLDFGLARVGGKTKLTKDGSTLGTVKYMSPEQIRNEKVDERTDIWSTGVILYEMVTRRYPFKGEYEASLFYSIINDQPEPIARYKSGITEGFQRIIDKALDKDPETRYQHVDDLQADLKKEKRDSSESIIINKSSYKKKKKYILSTLFIIVMLVGFGISYLLINKNKIIRPPKHIQLTYDGNIYFQDYLSDLSKISPNGQFIAYVIDNANEKHIIIKENSSGQKFNIINRFNRVLDLKWSPNGNEILVSGFSENNRRKSIIIQKFGGMYQDIPFHPYYCWSPNGSFLAGSFQARPDGAKKIDIIKKETGEIERSLRLSGDFLYLYDIDWSPRGDQIAFLTQDYKNRYEIWIIKTDGTQQVKLLEETNNIYSPRWSSDGNFIYFLQNNDMTQDLLKIDLINYSKESPKIIQTGLQAYGFSITKDNRKLCYTKINHYSNLYLFTKTNKNKEYQMKRLTEGTSSYRFPRISPDNKFIIYRLNKNIFKMDLNLGSTQQLTFLDSICYFPSWSPDSKSIAFYSGSKIYLMSSEGRFLKISKNLIIGGDSFSWESDSIIFYQKIGNRNFYLYNISSSDKKLLVPNDSVGWIFSPHLSPDNKKVAFFWNRASRGLWLIFKDASQKLIMKGWIYPLKWSEDSKSIYAINMNKSSTEIIKVSATTGISNMIFSLPSANIYSTNDTDISSDGNTIVAAAPLINSEVWMIENFDPDIE